jgi:hypothetical protein
MRLFRYGLLITSFFAASAFAQESAPIVSESGRNTSPVRFILNAAVSDGGDDLLKVSFRNADSEKIKAGGLLLFGGGVLFTPSAGPLSVQLTANYFFDSITAKNGDASFDRLPIELLAFGNFDRHRIGAGATLHLSPELEMDFDETGKLTQKFDDALGFVVQYEYKFSDQVFAGVRFTSIDYTADDVEDINGDNIGLTISFML